MLVGVCDGAKALRRCTERSQSASLNLFSQRIEVCRRTQLAASKHTEYSDTEGRRAKGSRCRPADSNCTRIEDDGRILDSGQAIEDRLGT